MVVDGMIRRLQFWLENENESGEAFYASPLSLSQVGENQLANRSYQVVTTRSKSPAFRLGFGGLNQSVRPGRDDECPIRRIRPEFAGVDVVSIAPWIRIDVSDIRP